MPTAVESRSGDLRLGLGAAYEANGEYPLSGLEGDLLRIASMYVAYAPADGVLVFTYGDVHRVLYIDERGPTPLALADVTEDGTTSDFGDFRIGTLVTLVGRPDGLSGGLHVEVELPNSDEMKGIGTNTTNFLGSLFASYAAGRLRATADLGIGILEAPLENFEQNDVFAYAGDLRYHASRKLGVFTTLVGHASTRGRVPLGTEDAGELWLGTELRVGPWLIEAGGMIGYGLAGRWGLAAELSRLFRL